MAKIMMPDDPKDIGIEPIELAVASHDEEAPANIIMAAAQGAQTGVKLAVAVGAMVLAFVALVALANGLLGGVAAGSATRNSASRWCWAMPLPPSWRCSTCRSIRHRTGRTARRGSRADCSAPRW